MDKRGMITHQLKRLWILLSLFVLGTWSAFGQALDDRNQIRWDSRVEVSGK